MFCAAVDRLHLEPLFIYLITIMDKRKHDSFLTFTIFFDLNHTNAFYVRFIRFHFFFKYYTLRL